MTLISLLVLAFSAWHVPFSLKKLWGSKTAAWPVQVAVFLLLGGYYAILVTGAYTAASSVAAFFYNALGLFFIFQIYLFFYLIAIQVLHPLMKRLPGKAVAATGLLLCLGLVGFGWAQAQSFRVTNHEVAVRGLAQPV